MKIEREIRPTIGEITRASPDFTYEVLQHTTTHSDIRILLAPYYNYNLNIYNKVVDIENLEKLIVERVVAKTTITPKGTVEEIIKLYVADNLNKYIGA